MTRRSLKIIGINPGTRYLGVAVFEGPELLDWGIKVLKGKWSKEKMKKAMAIIYEIVDLYQSNVLAIKKLHPSRRSENLKRFVAKIKELSKRKGIKIHQYSIKNLEEFFIQGDKLNKKNLSEMIVSEYPVLMHELEREKAHKNPYYFRMFEAVALVSRCFHQLDR